MSGDDPYRGFVVVREVMDRAIASGVAVLVEAAAAAHAAREPMPREEPALDGVILRALRVRGFVEVRTSYKPAERLFEIAGRHGCGSLCVVTISEQAARADGDAIGELRRVVMSIGCYCVPHAS